MFLKEGQHLPDQPLFVKVRMVDHKQAIRESITYSRARELFLAVLREAGVSRSMSASRQEFGLHSLWSRGVFSPLANPGLPVRLV